MLYCIADVELSPEGYHILSAMQEVIFDAFYRLLSRHHDNPDRMLSRVISIILSLLSVAKGWTESEKDLMKRYDDITFPQTLRYIYDVWPWTVGVVWCHCIPGPVSLVCVVKVMAHCCTDIARYAGQWLAVHCLQIVGYIWLYYPSK